MESDPIGQFRFAYEPPIIQFGNGCVDNLAEEVNRQGTTRALIVCGQTVGSTPAVMDPVRDGLGDTLAAVFDQTTPKKRLDTAFRGAELFADCGADTLVAVGGGSSLDVATVMSIVVADERSEEAIATELAETGTISLPDAPLPPVHAIPTTLAGADLSLLAGVSASPDGGYLESPVRGGVGHRRLMPAAVWYDPELVATTPREILTGSAMNGFDKGIESLYARSKSPVTDATAVRGLGYLQSGLPSLGPDSSTDQWLLEDVLAGLLLVQYGFSRSDGTTASLIHAFGHGLRAHTDLQQGIAHAIVAPHALEYLFREVRGRRELLAHALGVSTEGKTDAAVGAGVVEAVTEVRDSMGLPSRLRDVTGVERSDLRTIAETTSEDYLLANVPDGLDVSLADLEATLENAW